MTARIVFRADAGRLIGSGHVMRSLALASVFSAGGWKVGFAASAETYESVSALNSAISDTLVLNSIVADEPGMLARRWSDGADILVVDHYARDAIFERACRPWAKRIVVIDDLADRSHDAEVLVDAGASSPDPYRELVPPSAQVLAGPAYAIIHPDFVLAREAALRRRDGRAVERILVSFGQVDPDNATGLALDALEAANFPGEVDVALGQAAPHLAAIRRRAKARTTLHVNASNMPSLMTAADLAVGAGGVTSWERCCVGLPTALVTVADNQREVAKLQIEAGAAQDARCVGDITSNELSIILRRLMNDSSKRREISRAASLLVDGTGPERIVQLITNAS